MIFQIGWAALAAIFTFSIAMVVWGRNSDDSVDICFFSCSNVWSEIHIHGLKYGLIFFELE